VGLLPPWLRSALDATNSFDFANEEIKRGANKLYNKNKLESLNKLSPKLFTDPISNLSSEWQQHSRSRWRLGSMPQHRRHGLINWI
jgi:hypothetical protein